MKKWRIVKVVEKAKSGKVLDSHFLVEKRFLGFLWWYDPFDDGLYSDGCCDTVDEAIDLLEHSDIQWNKEVILERP